MYLPQGGYPDKKFIYKRLIYSEISINLARYTV